MSQARNAIVAYEGCPTAVFEAIFNQVVSLSTQENYASYNSDLILWIYEKGEWREALLSYWMVERLITVEDEGKKAMCATYKDVIKEINRNYDNCPILLEKMTFNLFSHYMSIKNSKNSGVYLLPPAMEVSVVH